MFECGKCYIYKGKEVGGFYKGEHYRILEIWNGDLYYVENSKGALKAFNEEQMNENFRG